MTMGDTPEIFPKHLRARDNNTKQDEQVSPGGMHVARLTRAAAPTGRDQGYLAYTQSKYAVFGCTCGEFVDGPAEDAAAAFRRHTTSDVFLAEPS
jgi:hypothetical protein